MPTSNQQLREDGRLFDLVQKFAIGLLTVLMTYQWNEVTRLEQRVYDLQRNSVTVEGVRLIEDRLTKQLDGLRIDVKSETSALRHEMNSKLDMLLQFQKDKAR